MPWLCKHRETLSSPFRGVQKSNSGGDVEGWARKRSPGSFNSQSKPFQMWLRVIIFVWYWYYDMNLIWPKKMFLWFQSYSVTVQSTTWSFAGLFGTTLSDWTTLSTLRSSSTRSLQTTWRDSFWSCQGKPLTRTLSTTSLKSQLSYTGNHKKNRG